MIAGTALLLGATAGFGSLAATFRLRRPAELSFFFMMVGWLVGELAVFHLVLQAVAVGWLVAVGALHHVAGVIGVALLCASMVELAFVQRRAGRAASVFEGALRSPLGPDPHDMFGLPASTAMSPPRRQAWLPFWFDHRGIEVIANLAYGEHAKRHRLDVYRPVGTAEGARLPVVVYLHGGAWVIGNKEQQGKPMMLHLARSGYICVAINYRLAPRDRWPAQIVDVKRAIVWIREHIAEYGGDPSFIAVCGSSAGGHLAALTALSAGDAVFQPGFEVADTSVDACVMFYAPFDLTDAAGLRGRAVMRRFLERLVMTTRQRDDEATWRAASPQWRLGSHAPPMFVIQGRIDPLVWREEAHAFVDALARCTGAPVVFAEVPGAQHAFEVFNSVRCRAAIDAVRRFLDAVRVATSR